MDAPETGFFRGAGGGIFELPLPLSENFQHQADRGQLTRVNADGGQFEEPTEPKRPAESAGKPVWVGYALAIDKTLTVDDADAMTKNDLIEMFGGK